MISGWWERMVLTNFLIGSSRKYMAFLPATNCVKNVSEIFQTIISSAPIRFNLGAQRNRLSDSQLY